MRSRHRLPRLRVAGYAATAVAAAAAAAAANAAAAAAAPPPPPPLKQQEGESGADFARRVFSAVFEDDVQRLLNMEARLG